MRPDEIWRIYAGCAVGVALFFHFLYLVLLGNDNTRGFGMLLETWVIPLLLVAIVLAILSFKVDIPKKDEEDEKPEPNESEPNLDETVTSIQCPDCKHSVNFVGTVRPIEVKCGHCGAKWKVNK